MESLMSVEQIAQRLNKAPKTVYVYIERGSIPPSLLIRMGNSIRMKAEDLEKWIESLRGK